MRCTLAFLMACLLGPSTALAQTDVATLSGRIVDQTEQPLPEVDVRVRNVDTNVETLARSNVDGIYLVASLHPGRYRVTVEKPGFKSIQLNGLALAAQDMLGRNFTMQLSPVTNEVTVTAGEERNLSGAVGTTVNRQFVEHMPLNGRSFQSLILLTPGSLVMAAGQGIEGQFSVNGQRTNSNYFTVDGLSANFGSTLSARLGQSLGGTLPALTVGGATSSMVSVDAMEEFRTQTSTYAPEFGRSPGAQVAIVTKSGTNRFTGTAFEYFRDDSLTSRSWFSRAPDPESQLSQHDFGGTFGGPVRRNRSFFFFSYERLRLEQPTTTSLRVLTLEARAAVAPIYRAFVDATPLPAGPVVTPGCDNITTPCLTQLTASFMNPTDTDVLSLRFDQTWLQRFTVFARGSHTPSSTVFRSFAAIEKSRVDNDLLTAGITAVLGSRLFNDVRVGWAGSSGAVEFKMDDFGGAKAPAAATLLRPGMVLENSQVSVLLPNAGVVVLGRRAANHSRQFNMVNTLSMDQGAHHFKIGVDYRRFDAGSFGKTGYSITIGNFTQLRLGEYSQVIKQALEPLTIRSHNLSMFAQDMWRPAPNLTVTYGLRWETNGAPESITDGRPLYVVEGVFDAMPLKFAAAGTPLWKTRYGNLAPRAGVTYLVGPSTILRGGGGLFHDLGVGRLVGNLILGFPYARLEVATVGSRPFNLDDPVFLPSPLPAMPAVTQSVAAFDPNLQLPRTWQWNASVERQLTDSQSLAITYLGAEGERLLRPDFVVPPGFPATESRITATRNAGASRYAALQVQFQRRLSHGLQAIASYTLASARDTESDDGGGNFFGAAINANTGVTLDQVHVPDLARADFDARHAFSTAVSYAIPAPPWSQTWRSLLGGWSVDMIARASTPTPINVRIQGVSASLGPYYTQPDLVPGQAIWLDAPGQPGGKILNSLAFTLPPPGQTGTLARNSISGTFGINQTDLSLRRSIPIGATSVEGRIDVFNVFNRSMFAEQQEFWGRCTTQPCTTSQNPAFGTTLQTLNDGLGGGGLNGGQSAIYAVGGPRSVQLSLKLRF